MIVVVALPFLIRPAQSPAFTVGKPRLNDSTVVSFAVGNDFAVMVAPDGSLWVWGDQSRHGVDFGLAASAVPQRLGNDTDWKQVTAGFYGFLALKKDGSLWALGGNGEGLLGLPPNMVNVKVLTRVGTDHDWKVVKSGVAHCMALKHDGSLWAWGQNQYGQIGVTPASPKEPPIRIASETNWISISPGAFQSYALRSDGTIWAWGQGFPTS